MSGILNGIVMIPEGLTCVEILCVGRKAPPKVAKMTEPGDHA